MKLLTFRVYSDIIVWYEPSFIAPLIGANVNYATAIWLTATLLVVFTSGMILANRETSFFSVIWTLTTILAFVSQLFAQSTRTNDVYQAAQKQGIAITVSSWGQSPEPANSECRARLEFIPDRGQIVVGDGTEREATPQLIQQLCSNKN